MMPFLMIMDKSKGIPVRSVNDDPIKNFDDVVVPVDEIGPDTEFYYTKYKEPIFMQNMRKEIEEFLEKYLEAKLDPYYQTERMIQRTRVKEICADTFEREVVRNPKVEQCVIQVFKTDCPSCMYNGKVFAAFSRKLEKHGYLDKLP